MAHALPQGNWIDRAIEYVAPRVAARRTVARMQLALAGGYTGGRVDRASLSRWQPGAGSPTTDIIRDLPMLRARSRDQMRNSPVALGAVNTTVGSVVGTGLSCRPSVDAAFLRLSQDDADAWQADADRRFAAWAESTDCDLGRRLNFYGIQDLAFRSMLESGDTFVVTPRVGRDGRPKRLALQLLEADRICNPNRAQNTPTLVDGIEIDPDTSEALACHVARRHPGDALVAGNEWSRIPFRGAGTGRRNVLQMFKPLRPGQVRGVPLIAPILEPLKQLNRWTEAELNAAVISGMFSVFIKMDPDAFDDMFDDDTKQAIVQKSSDWSGEMESGKAINLLPGESVETSTPGRPNPAFDPFWAAMVRQIGMALEMPFEVLVMHFQSSYSAARAALLMAWKAFRARRDLLVTQLCQPVYELWLADEVAEGRIVAPGFFHDDLVRAAWCKAVWTGDGPGSLDPTKDVDAAERRVNLGISTLDGESINYDGVPWEVKHRQRIKEVGAQREAGIYYPPAGRGPADSGRDAEKADE